nr:IclR family transcriptional regulator [Pseudonocardia acaciae]
MTRPMTSALKLLRLLDAVGESDEPVRLADLARELGASRSEVHRHLVTLVTAGWMEKLPDGAYQLTVKAAHLGNAALQHAGFGERVTALLVDLAEETGQSVCLAVLDDDATRVIKRAEPGTATRVTLALGHRMSLLYGATGRALAAFAPADVVAELRARGVRVPEESELAEIRRVGYALTPPGGVDGVAVIASPVPARAGAPKVALCVVGPAGRFDPLSVRERLAAAVRRLARLTASVDGGVASWEA